MKKKFLDSIDVPNPCEKNWDEMIGNEKVRHCLHCDKDIHNLSEMSAKEAQKLFFQNKGRVCVRLTRDADGKILTNDKPKYQITRRAKLATSVLSITLALTTAPFAQTAPNANDKNNVKKQSAQKNLLKLKITDSNKGVVPNAQVKIINLSDKTEQTGRSNLNGELEFVINKFGIYEIIVNEVTDFNELKKTVILSKENLTMTLQLDSDQAIIGTTETSINTTINQRQIESLPRNNEKFFLGLVFSPNSKEIKKLQKQQRKTSRISFTILDPNNQVISNAQVKLTNYKTNQEFVSNTNTQGIAYFSLLPHGRYKINASATFFRSTQMSVFLKEAVEPNIEISLDLETFTGIVSINWYEIPIFNSIIQDDFDVVKNYIAEKKTADIKYKSANNLTMLHVAAEMENLEIIKLLIDANADVNAKDKIGRTPIMLVDLNEENSLETIKLLISKGANLNFQNKQEEGETLLMAASDYDNLELVKILLEAGANPNLRDENGETAMMKTSSEEIKNLLKKYGAKR